MNMNISKNLKLAFKVAFVFISSLGISLPLSVWIFDHITQIEINPALCRFIPTCACVVLERINGSTSCEIFSFVSNPNPMVWGMTFIASYIVVWKIIKLIGWK